MMSEDKKWQAECDANTMRRYAEIINDTERVNLAKKHLEEQADSLKKALGQAPKTNKKENKATLPKVGRSNPATLGKLK